MIDIRRVANIVFQKSGNFAKCLTYALPQAIGLHRHRRSQLGGGASPVFVSSYIFFRKIESKFLSSSVLASFVMGCAKASWF